MADFGKDLSCVTDLDPTLRVVSGRTALMQAIARHLITPRGRLEGDPNYGFDLAGYLNDDVTQDDIAWMEAQIEAECLKDERVESATVTVAVRSLRALTIELDIQVLITDASGPFQFTLRASEVTVELLTQAA